MVDGRGASVSWSPAPSQRERWGLGLLGLSLLGMVAAGGVFLIAEPAVARLGGLALFLGLASCGSLIAATFLHVQSMRYVLGPHALEVRSTVGRLRVRYEQIDRIGPRGNLEPRTPVAWPGAYVGDTYTTGGRVHWHATTLDPARAVRVEWPGGACVVSPSDPSEFAAKLQERVVATVHLPARALPFRRGPVEWMTQLDPGFRLLVLLGLIAAAVVACLESAARGTVPSATLVAVVALFANAGLGATVDRVSNGVARILAAGALATVLVAAVW